MDKLIDTIERDIGKQAARRNVQDHRLLPNLQWVAKRLLQNLHQVLAVSQCTAGILIQIRTELGEYFQLAEAGQINTQRTGCFLDRLGLCGAAYTGNRQADVDRRTLTRKEQIVFQIDLSIRDRNDIGGDVRRNVTRLRFDDRQCGHRAAAVFLGQMAGALQQTRMQIEYVARIRFTTRRAAQQQRQGSIGDRRAWSGRRRQSARLDLFP